MQSQIETLSPVLVEVKIEVPWSQVSDDLENAYRSTQRTAHIRGFRPGKAPREVVKNVMGKSIRSEVVSELVRKGIGHAVAEHSLEVVAVPDVQMPTLTDGAPLAFSAKVEVWPKIESVDTAGIEIERRLVTPTDADVSAEVERMRDEVAEIVSPEPARAAAAKDILTVDLEVSVDGVLHPELGGEGRRVELGADKLMPELEAGLAGVCIGEQKDIAFQFPADHGHEAFRGKPCVFRVAVKNIQYKVLPEVDDELAKDLGHDSIAALRQSVQQRLSSSAQERAQALLREEVVERLIDKNPIAIPPSMVGQEVRAMLEQYARIQQMLGRPLPFDESVFKDFHERAERKVRAGLLFGAIARAENIQVAEPDVEARLQEIAERTGKHIAKVRADHQGDERRALERQLLEQKLLEYLLGRATIKDVPARAPEESTK